MFAGFQIVAIHNFLGGSPASAPVGLLPAPPQIRTRRIKHGIYRYPSLRANLGGSWTPFDRGSDIPDRSGRGQLAELAGAKCDTIDSRRCWLLNGVDNYIDFGYASSQVNVEQFTWSAWLYRSSTGTKVQLCRSETDGFGGQNSTELDWWDDGLVYCYIKTEVDIVDSRVANTMTGWHHFAMVFDGSKLAADERIQCYIDGVKQTLTNHNLALTRSHAFTNAKLLFGAQDINGPYRGGACGGVEIYDRALGKKDITVLALKQNTVNEKVKTRRLIPYGGPEVLLCDTGSYALVGQASASLVTAVMGTGAYTVSGQPMISTITTIAGTGSYTVSGQGVNYTVMLRAATGVYIVDGQEVGAVTAAIRYIVSAMSVYNAGADTYEVVP